MNNNPQTRYETPLVAKKLPDGRVVYMSARPVALKPLPLKDLEITSSKAIRMDTLAKNTYGSAVNWWVIASANGRVDGSLYFRAGSKIIIPAGS